MSLSLTLQTCSLVRSAQLSSLWVQVWLVNSQRRNQKPEFSPEMKQLLFLWSAARSLMGVNAVTAADMTLQRGTRDGLMWCKLTFWRHFVNLRCSHWGTSPQCRSQTPAALYCRLVPAFIPPTHILPRSLYSVIKAILIQKRHFPHPSPVIIFEAYFKCRVINHVMVEVPLSL